MNKKYRPISNNCELNLLCLLLYKEKKEGGGGLEVGKGKREIGVLLLCFTLSLLPLEIFTCWDITVTVYNPRL